MDKQSDTWNGIEICYVGEINRRSLAFCEYQLAYKSAELAFREFPALSNSQSFQSSYFADTFYLRTITIGIMLLNNAFELIKNAYFVERGFLVHKIRENANAQVKKLIKKQENSPVQWDTLLSIIQIAQDSAQHNYHPNLVTNDEYNSLSYSWYFLKPAYKETWGLSEEHSKLLNTLRKLRNQIHFQGMVPSAHMLDELNRLLANRELLCEAINTMLVTANNHILNNDPSLINRGIILEELK